jgi:thioredoxin reductase (NADPH)
VLIAAGAGSFTAKRLPNREFDVYEGRGLHYSVSGIMDFEDKDVLVVGGGDSAVDWALNLQRVAASITLIHRRDKFLAHEDSVQKLLASDAEVRLFRELHGIEGNGRVERAILADSRTGEHESLEVDAILVNFGFVSTLGPIREWGLRLEGEGIVVDSMMRTSLPGVFAAGDVASFPGKLKLIATGFGEAATAVNHAKVFIDPGSKSFPGHSSTIVPRQRQTTG